MTSRRARIVALWVIILAASIVVVSRARYSTDLSAFLPANPTPMQKVLVDQLRDGPASRLILIALEGGDAKTRASISARLGQGLRSGSEFSSVDNGAALTAGRDRDFLFQHRYLLSDQVSAQRFSAAGLRAAIDDTIEGLSTSGGLLLKSLVPHDPTGETLHILDQLAHTQGPRTQDGVWMSADGTRTLLVAQTTAAGSDTDAQERALNVIRAAFVAAASGPGASAVRGTSAVHLRLSGPGVFAVAARAKIKQAAMRLSVISSILVICVLLAVYRSFAALVLGLLPVATGALVGIAAVALGFGVVHGITLGFGITLIGESVDYSIYFFIQALRSDSTPDAWRRLLWPTIRLGMFTSVCGFASLLPSGFPGLAQLGLYSISGLVAAALVTRFVLPQLMPRGFTIHDVAPLGLQLERWRNAMRHVGDGVIVASACTIAAVAAGFLYRHHETLWNRELAALSPVSPEAQLYDAKLRSDLGAADVLDLVVVSGSTLEAVLQGAERAGGVMQSLIDAHVIGDYDSPTSYLPSHSAQQSRRDALPDVQVLRESLRQATVDSELKDGQLAPFVADVDAARNTRLLGAEDLRGTSLATGFDSLILHQSDRWSALLPLHAPLTKTSMPDIDVARIGAALAAAHLDDAHVLDLKGQTDALYVGYLNEAMHLSLAGFLLIVVLLSGTLRSVSRVLRVLAPLVLAVLVVAATLVYFGQHLTILHLVGMLLIVAVGSNYALFFAHESAADPDDTGPLTLASLAVANVSTVIGFGLLSFSQVPVLEALGMTVAPGAFLALLFSALITSRTAPPPRVLALA